MKKFDRFVCDRIGHYVYMLIDPRDNSIFYVGKGYGNRVFDHVNGALKSEADGDNEKCALIREIVESENKVKHFIVRWGLSEDEALSIESVLIDLFSHPIFKAGDLKNKIEGHGTSMYGIQSTTEIERKISRGDISQADIDKSGYNILCITVTKPLEGPALYDRVRGAWNLSIDRAKKADLVFAVYGGTVIGIYKPECWEPAKPENNKKREWVRFTGMEVTDPEILDRFLFKRMPTKSKGNSNPIKYIFK